MASRRKRSERDAPADEQPHERRAEPPLPPRPATEQERVLALQRGLGNRATSELIARSEVTTAVVRFAIGADISFELANKAYLETASGPLGDAALARLRAQALANDESIDDNERMFLAALFDPGNVRTWREQGPAAMMMGAKLEFPAASITSSNRDRVRNFGRGTRPPEPAGRDETADERKHAAYLDENIVAMARPFDAVARDALAIADGAKIDHVAIYFAMLNGASDSTPGDRAFAGAVYAIARREGLAVAPDILAGRIKIDQVPRAALPQKAEGMYQPSASSGGRKGDTVYLPSDLKFTDIIAQALIVHELTHAEDDKDAAGPHDAPVVDSELTAFRAEAGFLLHAVAKRTGDDRKRAVEQIAKDISPHTLFCMVLEATEVLEYERALTALREIHEEVVSGGSVLAARALPRSDFSSLLRRLADEELHWDAWQEVEKRAKKAIGQAYRGISPARDDGLRGESALDSQ